MAGFLQFIFSGLTVGAVYALVGLGFTLIFNVSSIINFAQGEFVMLGGMITVFGVALRRLAIERARGSSPVVLIMITIGASIFLQGMAQQIFDKRFHSLPPLVSGEPLRIGGATILPQSVLVLLCASAIVVGLWLFVERTMLGKAVIATAAKRLDSGAI